MAVMPGQAGPPSVSPSNPFGALGAGPSGAGSPDAVQQTLTTLVGQLRNISDELDDVADSNPTLAPEVQQVKNILRTMIVKAAQQAPGQNASTLPLPGAGQ